MKDALKVIGFVLLLVLAVPFAIAASAYIGYFFGIIVMWLAGGILTDIGVDTRAIPSAMAWLFVLGSIIGGGTKVNAGGDE